MTGIGENTLAQPVKPPLRERRACLAKLVKNRLTLTVAVHDAASGPSRPINYDPDHYGQALEGKRGLADADIAEAARANLALLDSLGGA